MEDIEKEADALQEKSPETDTAEEKKAPAPLMQEEDQDDGQVPWSVYQEFFAASGSTLYLPLVVLIAVISRAIAVYNQIFLGWWSSQRFPSWSQKDYIVVYSSLGVVLGILVGLTVLAWQLLAIRASRNLFTVALDHVIRSPVTWWDTTPTGRIVSRLTKDIKNLDTAIGHKLSMVVTVILSVASTLGLVVYTFPLLGPGIIPLAVLYVGYFLFYRRNSVAIKRLSSTLRSATYNAYNETLSGLSTVRATRQEERFIRRTEEAIDLRNRAVYVSAIMSL